MHCSNLLKKLRCDMNREMLKKAENIITEKRLNNERIYNDLLEEFSKDKTFARLRATYQNELIENAKKDAYGKKVDRTREKALKKELDEYFKKNGQINEVNYSCKKCKDQGYIDGNMCNCLKKEISNILLEESNFGKLVSFKDAEKGVGGNLKLLYQKMQEWCHSDFKKNTIIISGQVGTGKTYLTKAIANELITFGKIVKLVSAFQMNIDFNEYVKTKDKNYIDDYLNCEFLFIDDLGTEVYYKNSTDQNIYNILNDRQIKKLCTIITTNLDLAEIKEKYGERTFSRITNKDVSILVNLKGEDLRINKK